MPAYAVDLLEAELGTLAGARVVILGVAYRGNVKEAAFSGAFALRDALAARGAELFLQGLAPLLIFSGGLGTITRQLMTTPEAEVFATIAEQAGVPRDRMLVELVVGLWSKLDRLTGGAEFDLESTSRPALIRIINADNGEREGFQRKSA